MHFDINKIEELDVSDTEITELLTEVYVDSGFVTHEMAKSLFVASSIRQRGLIIGARDVENHEFSGMIIVVYPESAECRFDNGKEVEFHLLGVISKYRNKGLGKLLVTKAIEEVCNRGYPSILLATQNKMYAAHKLYESLGFERKEALDFNRGELCFLVYEKVICF